jgi:hypothetical protein
MARPSPVVTTADVEIHPGVGPGYIRVNIPVPRTTLLALKAISFFSLV